MTLKLKNSNIFKQLKRQSEITVVTATTSSVAVLVPLFKYRNWIRSKASPCWICGGHSSTGIDFCRIISVSTLWPIFLYSFIGYRHYRVLQADSVYYVKLFSLPNRKFPSYFCHVGVLVYLEQLLKCSVFNFISVHITFLCEFISKNVKTCGKLAFHIETAFNSSLRRLFKPHFSHMNMYLNTQKRSSKILGSKVFVRGVVFWLNWKSLHSWKLILLFSSYVPTDRHTKGRTSRENFTSGRQGLPLLYRITVRWFCSFSWGRTL
jgi:hypothetical protein